MSTCTGTGIRILKSAAGTCLGGAPSVLASVIHTTLYFGLGCASMMLLVGFLQQAATVLANDTLRLWRA
jgi:hypothetical protein